MNTRQSQAINLLAAESESATGAPVLSAEPEYSEAAPVPLADLAERVSACWEPATENWATPAYSDPAIVSAAHPECWAPDLEYSAAAPVPLAAFAPASSPPLSE
jgi:hypothetical protein